MSNEKDLKKCSKRELVELLLSERKETEKLRTSVQSLQNRQINEALLKRVEKITNDTNSVIGDIYKHLMVSGETGIVSGRKTNSPEINQEYPVIPSKRELSEQSSISNDRQLFNRLLLFYSENIHLVNCFPKDIQQEISDRLDKLFIRKT